MLSVPILITRLIRIALFFAATSALLKPLAGLAQYPASAEIALSLGSTSDGTIYVGEPLDIRIRLSARGSTPDASIILTYRSGTWTDAVTFTLRDATGKNLAATPTLNGATTERTLRLSSRRHATAGWTLARAQLQPLPPGRYQIVAHFTPPATAPQTTPVESEPVEFELAPFPATPTPAQASHRARAIARAFMSENDFVAAEKHLDERLKQSADDPDSLLFRARLKQRRGDAVSALVDTSDAIAAWKKTEPDGIPVSAIELRQQLLSELTGSAATAAPAPIPTSGKSVPPQTSVQATPPPPTPTAANVSAAATTPPSATNASSQPTAPTFAGVWNTNFGPVTLVVNGSQVTGSYPRNSGVVEGTIEGNVLRFDWKQTNSRGRGVFRLAADGKSFVGTFSYGTADPEGSRNTWNGTRTN
jgi:hypothetical protein